MSTLYYIGSDAGRSYYISHHGIKGQRWGVRRYQNEDGSLTAAGKQHVKSYSWFQDKLGYDERDRMRSAEALRSRTVSDVARTAHNVDVARTAVKNAQKRKDRADAFFKNAPKNNYITSPNGNLTANAWYGGDGAYQQVIDAWKEEQYLADEELTAAERALYEKKIDNEVWRGIYSDRRNDAEQKAIAYSKTPLGRLESAKSAISKGVSFVKNLFKRRK